MTEAHTNTDGERRAFPARHSALPAALGFVEDWCARRAIGHGDTLRLTLVVEELFTNSVVHGYAGESDAPIEISLATGDGSIDLCYEDAAPAHDPLARAAAAPDHRHDAVEARPVGGLGLHLVRELAPGARYLRAAGRNRLSLQLAVTDPPPPASTPTGA